MMKREHWLAVQVALGIVAGTLLSYSVTAWVIA